MKTETYGAISDEFGEAAARLVSISERIQDGESIKYVEIFNALEDFAEYRREIEPLDLHDHVLTAMSIVSSCMKKSLNEAWQPKPAPLDNGRRDRDRAELEFFRNGVAWLLKKAPDARSGDVPLPNGE